MGRKANIRYWQRKGGGFFTTHQGQQIELALGPDDSADDGPVYQAAMARWLDLVMERAAPADMRFSALLTHWHQDDTSDSLASSRDETLRFIRGFASFVNAVPAGSLQPAHVADFWRTKPKWNPTTRAKSGRVIMTILNWGARMGFIKANPLRGKLKLPQPRRRTAAVRLDGETMDFLQGACQGAALQRFLLGLRYTGARPIELREATWERLRGGRIVHPWQTDGYLWKNGRKTQRDRVIFVPPALAAELEAERLPHRDAPVFRTSRGHKWTSANVQQAFYRLLSAPSVARHLKDREIKRENVTLYGFRHSFISDWLEAGLGVWEASQVCGTSVAMIQRVYGHSDPDALSVHYDRFLGQR